jgi:low temperature requirement protein LtrA
MKPPVLRAVSKGEHGVRVSWFELFYDLVVVASVSHGSHLFGEHPSWGLGTWLAASLVLLMTFWLLTMVSHNFYPGDDVTRRFLVIVQMVALIVASLSLARGDEGLPDSVGFTALAIGFLSLAFVFWRCTRQYPDTSASARVLALSSFFAAVIMAVGALLPSNGNVISNPITWAFTLGMLCGIVPLLFIVLNDRTSSEQINTEHLSERMGQLVLIVLGESFVSLIFSLSGLSAIPNPWYFLLDFIVVLAIWTLYFTGVLQAGVPATAGRLRAWLGLHVIFIFGAIATAGGFAALTLIPFAEAPTSKAFWTPLPLFYVMIGLFGLSVLIGRPRRMRAIDGIIALLLAVLSALALWVIPEEARWLTLVAAALVILDAAFNAAASRVNATN